MAIWYVDPVGGSDSNSGASFALRKLTITSLGSVAAGDEVRVMGIPSPTLVGDATFTDLSATVTLASPVTMNIDTCDTAWTANTNVTCSAFNGVGGYKEGSASARQVVAAAFTTGRIAHKQIGGGSPVDFSAYQQISLWIRSTTVIASGVLQIQLCSDTAGTTPVNSLTVTVTGGFGSTWRCITLDNGSALSNNVQSVALVALSDPGSATIDLDNILACLAPSDAASLSLTSLIGKNTAGETFYPLQSINGTTVIIGGTMTLTSGSSNLRGYTGTTATTSLYKIQPVTIATNSSQTVSSFGTLNFSGTAAQPITVSGGWNTTDMTTQDYETWIDQKNVNNIGIKTVGRSWINISKLNFVHFYNGIELSASSNNITITEPHCHGQFAWGVTMDPTSGRNTVTSPNCQVNGNYGLALGTNCAATDIICAGNATCGLIFSGGNNNTVTNGTVRNNQIAIDFNSYSNNRVYDVTTGNSVTAALTVQGGTGYMFNCTIPESTEFTPGTTFVDGKIFSHSHDDTADNYIIYTDGGQISSDSVNREKTSGVAWKMDVTSANRTSAYPLTLGAISRADSIKIACAANKLVTVSARVMRNNTGITLQMVVPGAQIAGVPADVTASAAAAASTYETITLTFTPTEAGVVDVIFRAYGGTTYSAWIDRMSILQAA